MAATPSVTIASLFQIHSDGFRQTDSGSLPKNFSFELVRNQGASTWRVTLSHIGGLH